MICIYYQLQPKSKCFKADGCEQTENIPTDQQQSFLEDILAEIPSRGLSNVSAKGCHYAVNPDSSESF